MQHLMSYLKEAHYRFYWSYTMNDQLGSNPSGFWDEQNRTEQNKISVDELIEIMKANHEALEKLAADFYALRKSATANQEKTPDGTYYHIQETDYRACSEAYGKCAASFENGHLRVGRYYNKLSPAEKKEVIEKGRPCTQLTRSLIDSLADSMHGEITGLTYLYKHPAPEARRRYEHDYEHACEMRNMFGFS